MQSDKDGDYDELDAGTPGDPGRPQATTPYLNRPLRDRQSAALDIARGTLIGIRAGLPAEYPRTRAAIDKALADIDALVPEGKAFPARSVIAGTPGRVIRGTTDAEVAEIRRRATER